MAASLVKVSPWWGVVVLIFAAGSFVERERGVETEIVRVEQAKVDTAEYHQDVRFLSREIRQLNLKLDSANLRLTQILCDRRPSYCR